MIAMLLCDILSQLPSNGYILPINAVTALIGAPIVLWILLGRNKMVV
jgi:iron complex transport system permease protein